MYNIAKVAVEDASHSFDKEYSYFIPGRLEKAALAGCRVRVPFGRGNKSRTGIILSTENTSERDDKIKPILTVLDEAPVLDSEGLTLLRYLKEFTFCTWFDGLKTLVPAGIGLRPQLFYSLGNQKESENLSPPQLIILEYLKGKKKPIEENLLCKKLGISPDDADLNWLVSCGFIEKHEHMKQKVMDEKITMVRLCEEIFPGGDLSLAKIPSGISARQREVISFLLENETASLKEICYYNTMTRSIPDNLMKKGLLEYYDVPRFRNPYENAPNATINGTPDGISPLSASQQEALDKLVLLSKDKSLKPALLYGVTGSGKTQVFLALIEQVVTRKKSVIVLVPEISLTAQTVEAFHRRFGKRVAVLHSGLSMGERMDEWKRIRSGDADIVIGTRSAVFAPVKNLGLIVIDEEQEHTYHSEKSPRYHARDVAKFRCSRSGAMLLLSSATPSIESFYYAQKGKYSLITLSERFGEAQLPDVYMVDMREAENLSFSSNLSEHLLQEINYNLQHGEQSILLLNRRGYSTLIKCSACGSVEECPNCSVSLTYHTVNDSLICHYCGFSQKRPQKCSHCDSEMIRFSGLGTQKIQEELTAIYPNARILRVDMDTTLTKFSHEKLFSAFLHKEYDIMIGTQMVAKGLNFPDVTLVGVLAADQSLYATDFRSYERSFSLLTQVVGRSGRGNQKGRAIIQTFSPEHPIIELAANQNFPLFYKHEIISRKHHLYPPFCTLAGIGFVSASSTEILHWPEQFLEKFKEMALEYPNLPIRVLGPADADTYKVANKYRRKLIVKCKNNRQTRELFRKVLEWFFASCKTVSAYIDMYYDRI